MKMNKPSTFQLVLIAIIAIHSPSSILSFQQSITTTFSKRVTIKNQGIVVGTTTSLNVYEPKWKKKETLEKGGTASDVGLVGTVSVVFKQGNETKTTTAIVGQPLSDVASQAGQFIKYGCGKGECGTCESLCNGKWVRPCTSNVPADLQPGEELVITIKQTKNKAKSSGKFYSARSFVMGAYNNILGMVAFVKTRKYASKNWNERQEYEDLVAKKVAEKKKARADKVLEKTP